MSRKNYRFATPFEIKTTASEGGSSPCSMAGRVGYRPGQRGLKPRFGSRFWKQKPHMRGQTPASGFALARGRNRAPAEAQRSGFGGRRRRSGTSDFSPFWAEMSNVELATTPSRRKSCRFFGRQDGHISPQCGLFRGRGAALFRDCGETKSAVVPKIDGSPRCCAVCAGAKSIM